MSEVKLREGQVPPGEGYIGQAIAHEIGQTPNGTDYVRIDFRVLEGDHKGKKVAKTLWLSEKAAQRSVETLYTLGCTFPGDDITDLTGFDANQVRLSVQMQTKRDGSQTGFSEVQWVNPMAKEVSADVSSRMKGLIMAGRSGAAKPAEAAKKPWEKEGVV